MLRKFVFLASILATLVAVTALPAGADPTTATFQLTAGGLSISVPTSVSLGSQVVSSSASTISGQLGLVTVTDQRGGATTWVVSLTVTAFTPTTGPAVTPIAGDKVSYAAGTITQVGVVATQPGTTNLTLGPPVVNGASTGLSTASWNPTISVLLPANAAPGIYTATITHSVA